MSFSAMSNRFDVDLSVSDVQRSLLLADLRQSTGEIFPANAIGQPDLFTAWASLEADGDSRLVPCDRCSRIPLALKTALVRSLDDRCAEGFARCSGSVGPRRLVPRVRTEHGRRDLTTNARKVPQGASERLEGHALSGEGSQCPARYLVPSWTVAQRTDLANLSAGLINRHYRLQFVGRARFAHPSRFRIPLGASRVLVSLPWRLTVNLAVLDRDNSAGFSSRLRARES